MKTLEINFVVFSIDLRSFLDWIGLDTGLLIFHRANGLQSFAIWVYFMKFRTQISDSGTQSAKRARAGLTNQRAAFLLSAPNLNLKSEFLNFIK